MPATVVIVPSGATRRMRWFSASAIRKPPSGVRATPAGPRSMALVAGPSSPPKPAAPMTPATVVIVPPADTWRTLWLSLSPIRKLPSGLTATPTGKLSCALVARLPSPRGPAAPVPATVVMIPPGDTFRTRLLFESAIRKPPSGVSARPLGAFSWALVARPSSPL